MARKKLFRRGNKNALPTLSAGEPAFALDTKELYIGTGDGTASVVGSGDMLKSVYDTNNNVKVDDSDKLGGQPPEYYAAEYPVYTAWVERWQSNNKYYLNLPNAPNIAQSGMKKFAIDVVKNYGIENDNYIDVVYLYFGDDVSQEPTDTTSLYVHNESSGALLRVKDLSVMQHRYYFEKGVDGQYYCLNPITLGTTTIAGSVKTINSCDSSAFVPGEALSAYQGNVLFTFIDGVARQLSIKLNDKQDAFPVKPTLTALTPVGTTVGSSGWTGTGLLNIETSSDSAHDVYAEYLGFAYTRLNLKLAAGEDWRDWSAYYDKDGVEFPFYYSETRGLYDGIFPDEGLTLQQTIDKIRWVYRRKPEVIIYGTIGDIAILTLDENKNVKTAKLRKDAGQMRRIGTGDYGKDPVNTLHAIYTGTLDIASMPIVWKAKLMMTGDTAGDAYLAMDDLNYLNQAILNGTLLPIDTIDNWGA